MGDGAPFEPTGRGARNDERVRVESSVAGLRRRESIHPTVYYSWLKDFMEAGKARGGVTLS
jgi:hypothetical protein